MVTLIDISNEEIMAMIANSLQLSIKQVSTTLELLKEGNTVPFIARYRKEKTGTLDETQIRKIEQQYDNNTQLIKEKNRILETLNEQGKLTKELEASVVNANTLAELREIYSPYKQKKKTKGLIAREKGLEPLAHSLLDKNWPEKQTINDVAIKFVNTEIGVNTPEEALEGARHIIAEDTSNSLEIRELVRKKYYDKVLFTTKRSILYEMDEEEDSNSEKVIQGKKFEQYFDFEENALNIAPHRLLAMRRGDTEGILTFKVVFPDEFVLLSLKESIYPNETNKEVNDQILLAVNDCWKRLLGPSLQREIKRTQLEKAEVHSIQVFGENLKHLLLGSPLPARIIGLDPAFRTGCKFAAIDEMGNVLETGTIYPTKPHEQYEKSAATLKELVRKFDITIIAIGNGTASRETEEFVSKYVAKGNDKLKYVIVNEAGASVYSASDLAREEFPNLDVSIRGAISIARRLLDPLAELVKIDPRSIGVGQYQHDLSGLTKALKDVVVDTVNLVGVDLNTASEALLRFVSGITRSIAKNITSYRTENGAFVYRADLQSVPGIGPKTYEQSVGFLRIHDAPDPFDNSPIHPESYELAEQIINLAKFSKDDLNSKEDRERLQRQLKLLNPSFAAKQLKKENLLQTITDIISILQNPYRDPRDDFDKPLLKSSVLTIEDLEVGTFIEGTITNVTDFGCFVDIGVKANGLIHVSEMTERFIKHPREAGLKVGDIVKPRIKEIDKVKQRISLSLKKESAKKPHSMTDRSQTRSDPSGKPPRKRKPQTIEDKQLDSLFKNGKISL